MSAGTPAPAGKKNRTERSNPNSKKRRWSAEERAARGRRPRRRGGVDKPDTRFPDSSPDRPAKARRHIDRTVRTDRFVRPDADDRADRAEHPVPANEVTAVPATTGFAELGVATELVERLAADGISVPFPIQAASIPDAITGRDVLGRGRTGSGKTLGFGLPMLTRLSADRSGGGKRGTRDPRGLILLPTRELATQVSDVLSPLARAVGLRTQLVAGGMAYGPQLKGLENGVDIVIGTPGRIIDLMDRGALLLHGVQITVLDEADHMADLGFLPDVTTILDAIPGDGQRMLFSATLDRGVDRVVERYLTDPSTHQVDSDRASVDTMTHYLLPIAPADKKPITAEIANREGRTVIFVRTQLGADRVAEQLRDAGVLAGPLHGGLPQGARNRTLEAFKDGRLPVLVATDVAARGIHVDEVGLVLQADPPADAKTYLHRAGRTARAGQAGVVITLVLPNQRREVRRLAKDAGVAAIQLNARPGEEALAEATGSTPATADRITEREFAAIIAPPKRSYGRSGGRGRQGRPGGRQGGWAGDRSGNRSGIRSGNRSGGGSAGRSDALSDGRSDGRSGGRSGGPSGGRQRDSGGWNSSGRTKRAAYHSER